MLGTGGSTAADAGMENLGADITVWITACHTATAPYGEQAEADYERLFRSEQPSQHGAGDCGQRGGDVPAVR